MSDYVLETRDITKTFGNLIANDGISLGIERGEIHGIIGPNGSGKTTFFNTVSGFYKPDGGSVLLNGEDITGKDPDEIARSGLGRTFQIASPFEDLTVKENLLSVFTEGILSGFRVSEEKQAKADRILETLDIEHIADHEGSDISGGQQKLLEIGRMLMLEPDCIMLDEPTAGVNPALQANILEHLKRLNEDGTTFVIIEHDMSVIRGVTDRVTVLNNGQIVVQGSFDEVTQDERVRAAYLGERDGGAMTVDDAIAASATKTAEETPKSSSSPTGTDPEAATAEDSRRLRATNVSTGYGNHQVIHDVTVQSHDGVTCIFGPNGSGKSTLLKALIGSVPIWSGSITYGEQDITDIPAFRNLTNGLVMLPQDGGIFGKLTVRENLLLGAYQVDDAAVRRDRMESVLEQFPMLEEKFHSKGSSLSGGQQMMLSFARSMMTGADIYLLDEPSSGLAPSLIDDVFEMIDLLIENGAQVILVEQNVREAIKIADHVYILAQGKLQFDGPPDNLADEDDLVEMYLGLD